MDAVQQPQSYSVWFDLGPYVIYVIPAIAIAFIIWYISTCKRRK